MRLEQTGVQCGGTGDFFSVARQQDLAGRGIHKALLARAWCFGKSAIIVYPISTALVHLMRAIMLDFLYLSSQTLSEVLTLYALIVVLCAGFVVERWALDGLLGRSYRPILSSVQHMSSTGEKC